MLDAMTGAAALLRNGRMDILGANHLGCALYSEMCVDPRRPVNSDRFTFLGPRATALCVNLEQAADNSVAVLMFAFTAESGSRSAEALNLLASWTATRDEPERRT